MWKKDHNATEVWPDTQRTGERGGGKNAGYVMSRPNTLRCRGKRTGCTEYFGDDWASGVINAPE